MIGYFFSSFDASAESEIDQFRAVCLVEDHVLKFYISMGDLLVVKVF